MSTNDNLTKVKRAIRGFSYLRYFYRAGEYIYTYETECEEPLKSLSYMIREETDHRLILFESALTDHIYSFLEDLMNVGKQ